MEKKVLRMGALGDLLCCLNALEMYKKHFPEDRITFYTWPSYMDLVKASPAVSAVATFTNEVTDAIPLRGVTHNVFGEPMEALTKHITLFLCDNLGIEEKEVPSFKLNLPTNHMQGDYVTLQISSGWSGYKEWPHDCWQQVVNYLFPHICVVLLGSRSDPCLSGVLDLRGRVSFLEAISIVKGAKLHLGIDSFLNHATHVEPITPAIVLWGSTSPKVYGYGHNLNIWKPIACSPCYKMKYLKDGPPERQCLYDPGRTFGSGLCNSMQSIAVRDVLMAISQKLG